MKKNDPQQNGLQQNDNIPENSFSADSIGLIVHAYNNFLSSTIGFTELALLEHQQAEHQQESIKERLELSLASGGHAVHFGQQLLASVSRLQVTLKPTCLTTLFNRFCLDKNYQLINEMEVDQIKIKTDIEWFDYCLKSVCDFCIDFSGHQAIKLSLLSHQKSVIIVIKPEQLNLNTEQIKQLFVPFYSSRNLLGKKDIGLAVVKGFLLQMNFEIYWENNAFIIDIPKTEQS